VEDPSAPAGRRRGLKLESKTVRLINADDPLHGIGVVMIGAPGPPASRRFACARPPATKDG
jgi:hypothetical protein